MKKNFSKLWLFVLSVVMVISLFTGCGEKPADSVDSSAADSVSSSSSDIAEVDSEIVEDNTEEPKADSQEPVSKTITVEIVYGDESSEEFELETEAEFLRGALEENELIAGDESEYGLFVTDVNGVTANQDKQEWWCFTQDTEMLMTGVDTTPIADGDHFEITLTVGY